MFFFIKFLHVYIRFKGLCSNFNGIREDDFTLKSGEVLDLSSNRLGHYLFANDWEIEGTCVGNCRKRRDEPDDPWEGT